MFMNASHVKLTHDKEFIPPYFDASNPKKWQKCRMGDTDMITEWPSQLPKVPRGAGQVAQTDGLKRALGVLEQRTDLLKEAVATTTPDPNLNFVTTFYNSLNGTSP